MAMIRIENGGFQSSLGNSLAGGYLTFRLNTDARVGNVQLSANRLVTVYLDANGNVLGTISMWPNDQMTPTGTVYFVKAYTAAGELVWQSEQTITGSSPFDLNTWLPSISF